MKDIGGIGMILSNTTINGEELITDSHLLPAVAVSEKCYEAWFNSTRS